MESSLIDPEAMDIAMVVSMLVGRSTIVVTTVMVMVNKVVTIRTSTVEVLPVYGTIKMYLCPHKYDCPNRY